MVNNSRSVKRLYMSWDNRETLLLIDGIVEEYVRQFGFAEEGQSARESPDYQDLPLFQQR